jgi:hypothetical protein
MLIEAPPVVLSDGSICVISRFGLLVDCDAEAQRQWELYVFGYGCASPAVSSDGKVYLAGFWKYFNALQGSGSLGLTDWPKFRGNARNTGNVNDRLY